MKIIVNDFVRRQTSESRFSHYDGEWEDIVKHVKENFKYRVCGYRNGVNLIPVPPEGFFSGIAQLQESSLLTGGFEARREGEAPRKFVTAVSAQKIPAKHVDVVLYSSEVLAEDGDNQLPAEPGNWEIISVNASPTKDSPPINPMVLMHNHFESDGGTATGLSDEDFVVMLRESFYFWKDKAMCS